ncbi:tRNA splicing endonuclease subunit SEN54 NDAI_0C05590 [Naumovozyma dairenensis CBS 421]|uniref:tRNA-splicing endonuclease subunit Sen54 N-terminal domain-containing protein n=1 Tax=Naumovozyma dairenensis (strain ATCC 10597 / BCRC 20456 / CBS 421 / NBRC 0211 / NRRL Y-12639) TaxID=1071378 RepID=G0W8V7_NAUDC|nr:hypothetical protein NDAI_0C05590 [Naumovozyma dairenensis CBS 421]CCD24218.1 hypothetical protein NDAI_0C05590 [Naumovozyma dairenensis CBS 421]
MKGTANPQKVKDEAIDSDLDDDEIVQDWSEVAKLAHTNNAAALIPKRGEKDYEPDGTDIQKLLLHQAQKAMFDTLSHSIAGSVLKSLVKAYYIPDNHNALLPHPKGNFMQTMGRMNSNGQFTLSFHEFVYLAERGTVSPYILVPNSDGSKKLEIPLSIQDLYALFKSQQDLDKFAIYAQLKRLGFIVMETKDNSYDKSSIYPPTLSHNKILRFNSTYQSIIAPFKIWRTSLFNHLVYNSLGLLTSKYTTSPQIYETLNKLVPYTKAPKTLEELRISRFNVLQSTTTNNTNLLSLTFNVWKPQTNFKKKSPGLPDYQVAVYNKNDNNVKFPTYKDFQNIFNNLDYKFEFLNYSRQDEISWEDVSFTNGVPTNTYLSNLKSKAQQKKSSDNDNNTKKKKKRALKTFPPHVQQLRRLKAGYRSFLLAIMDDGIISFVKIAEEDFGSENVWYVPTATTNNINSRASNKIKNNNHGNGDRKTRTTIVEKSKI